MPKLIPKQGARHTMGNYITSSGELSSATCCLWQQTVTGSLQVRLCGYKFINTFNPPKESRPTHTSPLNTDWPHNHPCWTDSCCSNEPPAPWPRPTFPVPPCWEPHPSCPVRGVFLRGWNRVPTRRQSGMGSRCILHGAPRWLPPAWETGQKMLPGAPRRQLAAAAAPRGLQWLRSGRKHFPGFGEMET